MNKIFLASAFVFTLTGSALATHSGDETHNGKTVSVPTVHKSKGVYAPAAHVTPHGMVVTAPPGSNVDVDVDGDDIEIDVMPKSRGWLGLGLGPL